jgi:hypothetical protein
MKSAFRGVDHFKAKMHQEISALVVGAVGVIMLWSLASLPASAANVFSGVGGGTTTATGAVSALSTDVDADASFFGNGSVKSSNHKNGSISEIEASAGGIVSWQLRDNLLLDFGAQWQRFSFDPDPGLPVPDVLQEVNLVVGADFQMTPALIMHVELDPGIYSDFQNISSGAFFIPIEIGGVYFVSSDLLFALGVSINYDRDPPVFPGGGVRWQVTNKFLVNAILPKPQLEYKLTDKLTAHAGANLLGNDFRVSNDLASSRMAPKKLNNAILEYTEVRVGGGLSYRVRPGASLDVEAGFTPYRKFDYPRADFKVLSTDIAPYAQIAISAKF